MGLASSAATLAIANMWSLGGSYADELENKGRVAIATARFGVLRKQCFGLDSDPECKAVNAVINAALSKLSAQGAQLIDLEVQNLTHYTTFGSLYLSRSRNDIDQFLQTKKMENGFAPCSVADIVASKQYPPTCRTLAAIASGPAHPHQDPEYLQRLESRDEFQKLLVGILASQNLDALVFATCQILPPLHDDTIGGGKRGGSAVFLTNTSLASVGCIPSISVPVGLTNAEAGAALSDLPVDLEMVSLPFREQELLNLARGVEIFVGGRTEPTL